MTKIIVGQNDLNTVNPRLASSIKVGPKVHASDETFLVDPEELLDVDKCVAKYGGELDSFYEELPTDEPDTGFDPGYELTERNHALRVMKTEGTSRFFKKRIKDNAKVKETEARVGQLFPGHGEKKTERLFTYAGAHCINADFLIYILEDPDTYTTYENTVAFLSQFADASEFRMKLNLARELIEGKWYITADYNGQKTKFQPVPIDEINELREKVGLPVSKFSYKGEVKSDG